MLASALFVALSCAVPAKPIVRIGNFLVSAPNGISLIYDDRSAVVIDFGGDYVAGIAASDDSYHAQHLALDGADVLFEWGRWRNSAFGRLTADRDADVDLRIRPESWPNFPSYHFAQKPYGLVAEPKSQSGTEGAKALLIGFFFTEMGDPNFVSRFGGSSHPGSWSLSSDSAIRLKLKSGISSPFVLFDPHDHGPDFNGLTNKGQAFINVTAETIGTTLDKAERAYLKRRPTATGEWGDFVGAIADNLNNSRIYASDEKAVAHSVSRGWAGGNPNNAPFFCWDSFFNGALACLDDPSTARSTVRAVLGWQTPEGMVPNFGHWQFDKTRASNDRSQPPVGSMCVWKMHMRWPDAEFLKEVYPKLLRWHHWWPNNRDGDHNGLRGIL